MLLNGQIQRIFKKDHLSSADSLLTFRSLQAPHPCLKVFLDGK